MKSRAVWVVVCLACLLLLAQEVWLSTLSEDDPFISARYARNLVQGHGLVYNTGERVEGYSNLLWVLLLAFAMKLGVSTAAPSILLFAKIMGALFSIGIVVVVTRISFRLAMENGRSPGLVDTVAVVFVCASAWFAAWSVGGLETSLYILILLCSVYFYFFGEISLARKPAARSGILSLSSLFYGIAALTRPEYFFLFFAATAHRIWLYRVSGEPFRRIIRWLAPAVVIVIAYLLWRHHYYGYWLPNTFYAKSQGGISQLLQGLRYVAQGFVTSGIALAAPLILLPALHTKPKAWYTFCLLQCLAQTIFVVSAGGDWMYGFRQIVPILPFAALCLQEGVRYVLEWRNTSQLQISMVRLAYPALAAVIVLAGVANLYSQKKLIEDARPGWKSFSGGRVMLCDPYRYEAGLWLKQHAGPGSLVATGEAGLTPYVGEFRVLDCVGLMDPHIAHLKGKLHYKFDAKYVLSRKPDYLILLGERGPDGRIHGRMTYVIELAQSLEVQRDYRFARQFGPLFVFKRNAGLDNAGLR